MIQGENGFPDVVGHAVELHANICSSSMRLKMETDPQPVSLDEFRAHFTGVLTRASHIFTMTA